MDSSIKDMIISYKIVKSPEELLPGDKGNVAYILFRYPLAIKKESMEYEEFKTLLKETFEEIFLDYDNSNTFVYPNDDFLKELRQLIEKYL